MADYRDYAFWKKFYQGRLDEATPPSPPNRTDFKTWERATLERFAREAADENRVLRDQLAWMLEERRKELLRHNADAVSSGT